MEVTLIVFMIVGIICCIVKIGKKILEINRMNVIKTSSYCRTSKKTSIKKKKK